MDLNIYMMHIVICSYFYSQLISSFKNILLFRLELGSPFMTLHCGRQLMKMDKMLPRLKVRRQLYKRQVSDGTQANYTHALLLPYGLKYLLIKDFKILQMVITRQKSPYTSECMSEWDEVPYTEYLDVSEAGRYSINVSVFLRLIITNF